MIERTPIQLWMAEKVAKYYRLMYRRIKKKNINLKHRTTATEKPLYMNTTEISKISAPYGDENSTKSFFKSPKSPQTLETPCARKNAKAGEKRKILQDLNTLDAPKIDRSLDHSLKKKPECDELEVLQKNEDPILKPWRCVCRLKLSCIRHGHSLKKNCKDCQLTVPNYIMLTNILQRECTRLEKKARPYRFYSQTKELNTFFRAMIKMRRLKLEGKWESEDEDEDEDEESERELVSDEQYQEELKRMPPHLKRFMILLEKMCPRDNRPADITEEERRELFASIPVFARDYVPFIEKEFPQKMK